MRDSQPRCAVVWLLCETKSFFKITEKVKRGCRRTPHFHCVCFGEAERFMFGRLKPRIDAKKSFKSERVDTCLLAHTFPLAFLLPLSSPSSFSADPCSHAHIVISLPPPSLPPLHAPLLILSIHIAPLRGGGGQPWGGLGLPSSPSHLYPQGVPPLPPLSLPPLHPRTHPHTHHEHHHQVSSFIPTRLPLLLHQLQSFVRCVVSACVASFIVGWARSGLVALCDKIIFKNHRKSQKRLPQDTTLPLCLLWWRQSGSCLVG